MTLLGQASLDQVLDLTQKNYDLVLRNHSLLVWAVVLLTGVLAFEVLLFILKYHHYQATRRMEERTEQLLEVRKGYSQVAEAHKEITQVAAKTIHRDAAEIRTAADEVKDAVSEVKKAVEPLVVGSPSSSQVLSPPPSEKVP